MQLQLNELPPNRNNSRAKYCGRQSFRCKEQIELDHNKETGDEQTGAVGSPEANIHTDLIGNIFLTNYDLYLGQSTSHELSSLSNDGISSNSYYFINTLPAFFTKVRALLSSALSWSAGTLSPRHKNVLIFGQIASHICA